MKYLLIIVKAIASIGLLYLLFRKVNFAQVSSVLVCEAGITAVVIAVVIFLVQSVVAGYRTSIVTKLFDAQCSATTGFRIWLTGLFFGQTLITFIAGDAIRVWQLTQSNIPVRSATMSVVFDRVTGFVVLIAMFLVVIPEALTITNPTMQRGIVGLATVCTGIFLLFFIMGTLRFEHSHKWVEKIMDIVSVSRYFWKNKRITGQVVILSFVMHALNVIAIFALMRILGINIEFYWCWVLAQPIMLLTLLPISFAGWGVRESTMILGFGALGYSTDAILAVSVAFGVSLMISSLPGLGFFLQDRRNSSIELQGATTSEFQ